MSRAAWLVAPFVAWMALMAALPPTATAYAVRTAVTAALLAVVLWRLPFSFAVCGRDLACGVAAGLAVFVVWVAPEQFDWPWYRRLCILGEGGTEAVAEAAAWAVAVRLLGSAFVISVAEELFFRRWLLGFAGFGWMVALFAVEHDRWLVGAVAGAVYGVLAIRRGLASAIVAHATTNLVLGLWVLWSGQWQFW